MKISRKAKQSIREKANRYRKILMAPDPEVDAIINDLKASVKSQPKFKTKEEEIAYIIGDQSCDCEELDRFLKKISRDESN